MSSVFFLLVPLLAVAVLTAVVVAVVYAVARRPDPAPSEAAAAARRHGLAVNVTAWSLALGLGPLAMTPVMVLLARTGTVDGPTGNAVLTGALPAGVGLVFLGVHALGERTWPRPTGMVRRATLVPRGDVAPAWLRRITWAWAAGLAVTLVATGLTAVDGRLFRIATDAGLTERTTGPYPGWDFGVPMLLAALVVLAAAEGTLRLVARRPAVVDADPADDAASRRLSAHRVLRGAQLVLGLMLAGAVTVAGGAIVNAQHMAVGAPLVALGYALAATVLCLTLVPARPALPSTGPAGAAPVSTHVERADPGAPAPSPEQAGQPARP